MDEGGAVWGTTGSNPLSGEGLGNPRWCPVYFCEKYRGESVRFETGERIRVMTAPIRRFWAEDDGQDIAEYAVMLAVILVLVVGTIRLVGSNANNAFSSVASSLQ